MSQELKSCCLNKMTPILSRLLPSGHNNQIYVQNKSDFKKCLWSPEKVQSVKTRSHSDVDHTMWHVHFFSFHHEVIKSGIGSSVYIKFSEREIDMLMRSSTMRPWPTMVHCTKPKRSLWELHWYSNSAVTPQWRLSQNDIRSFPFVPRQWKSMKPLRGVSYVVNWPMPSFFLCLAFTTSSSGFFFFFLACPQTPCPRQHHVKKDDTTSSSGFNCDPA